MKVIGIHGIGHEFETAPEIKQRWLPALQGGLRLAGKHYGVEESQFPCLSEAEFKIADYGDLFRPQRAKAGSPPRVRLDDIKDYEEADLLLEWWQEAAKLSTQNRINRDPLGEDLTIQPPNIQGKKGRVPSLLQAALRQLAKSKFFNGLGGEQAILFFVKQVREYLHNPEMRQAIQERVANEVTEDTRIIIGHSLGSVVAYECLLAHPEWNVDTLITLGSPLGISPLIFDRLTPKPESGKGKYPEKAKWFNIADQGDIVALQKTLAPHFGAVEDVLVCNGPESHSVKPYLNAWQTGKAVASGLGFVAQTD